MHGGWEAQTSNNTNFFVPNGSTYCKDTAAMTDTTKPRHIVSTSFEKVSSSTPGFLISYLATGYKDTFKAEENSTQRTSERYRNTSCRSSCQYFAFLSYDCFNIAGIMD